MIASINYHGNASNLQLRPDADTHYADAEEMFGDYGAHVTDDHRDWDIQTVNVDWLKAGKTESELVGLILADTDVSDRDTAEGLAALAMRVWSDMTAIESQLAEAVKAYESGNLEACVEALQTAGHAESDHGDDPSTSDLAARLLEPRTAYRVYRSPEGGGRSYCGEYETLDAAQDAADKEPAGLEECLWSTAHAAGHCAGLTAPPDDGEESEEPESWHGKERWHCVVKVTYTP